MIFIERTIGPDGIEIVVDNRDFDACKEHQLAMIRERAMQLIDASVPDFKQRNAALGILSEQERHEIVETIQAIRSISNAKEAEINAIVWDGSENTRRSACDAVQAIRWP